MTLPPSTILLILLGASAYLAALYVIHQSLQGAARALFRWCAVGLTIAGFFYGLHLLIENYDYCVDIAKFVVAATAAGCCFYEQRRAGAGKPIAERWKRFVGIALACSAIICYFNGFRFGYVHFFHRWDQFHYYMGAKYFREMGYDGLYKCAAIAEDELGTQQHEDGDDADFPNKFPIDLSEEVRHGDKKIRNLGGDNLLIPVTEILAHPEICKATFTPERWEDFKDDVRYFRLSSDKTYWTDMQKDHGYNPPPVWTILGYLFANLHGASMRFLQALAGIDVVYLAGTFLGLWWAFGWRVFAVAAIFWGTQASASAFWTQGAFLRQDWLFFMTMAACFARKKYWKLAGASMVYTGLLRVFPGLTVFGWLSVVGWQLYRHRRLASHHKQMLIGGVLAAVVLIPTSVAIAGKDSYKEFYRHTLEVHDRTPLTNHMGLRVLISNNVGSDYHSGRMKYVKDDKLADPFEVWKRMRNERYDKYKLIAYLITALSMAYFVWVTRRIKNMWVAQCLAQIFIILMSQLTCYYYVFLILTAPLTKVRRDLEAPLFGLALATQVVAGRLGYNDDKYTVLTLLSLIFCYGVLCAFSEGGPWARVRARIFRPKEEPAT